jgi:hypothetical protein
MGEKRMAVTDRVSTLFELALERSGFFDIKGPSVGDKDTAAFMGELRKRAAEAFGSDFAEQKICGPNGLCVDYYFPEDAAIVEIAMGLRNPNSEIRARHFESDHGPGRGPRRAASRLHLEAGRHEEV